MHPVTSSAMQTHALTWRVITIASERTELTQLTMGARATSTLVASTTVVAAGATLALVLPDTGARLLGLGLIMAQAPIIFPAGIARPLRYRSARWVPFGLLQVGRRHVSQVLWASTISSTRSEAS